MSSSIGGNGWPQPKVLHTDLADPAVSLAGGIDLSFLKNKAEHAWVMVVIMVPDIGYLEALYAIKQNLEADQAAGKPLQDVQSPPFPLDGDKVVKVEGPGCSKCGLLWYAPGGFSEYCTVEDAPVPEQSAPDVGDADAFYDNVAEIPDLPEGEWS